MIYLRLAGGLGNQLFQLAAASLLSSTNSTPVIPLTEGLSHYDEPRSCDFMELLQPLDWLHSSASKVPLHWRCFALKARAGRWLPSIGVSDRNFWHVIASGNRKDYILDGYFQRGWTTETFNFALNLMSVRTTDPDAAARIGSNEVVIHIRGGDFLRFPKLQVVDAVFYVRAVRQAMEHGLYRFAILSDDAFYAAALCEKIRERLPGVAIRLIPRGSNALEDFDTIRSANARIIGNSTFAWWAAALGKASARTWSPKEFTRDIPRDFFLSCELPLESGTQA